MPFGTILDLLIVVAFIIASVSMGLIHRRKASRSLEDFFLAGRSVRGWRAGISMAATQYAADTPLLVTGLVATAGIFSVWRLWIYGIAFLLLGFVFAGPWRRSHVLTDAELMELRYSGRLASTLRALKAIHMGTLINCTVLAMVLIAAARIAEPFLTWHLWLPPAFMQPLAHALERLGFLLTMLPASHPDAWTHSADNMLSITAIVAFTWAYSTTGGLRSVIGTDVLQFAIMMIATALYAAFVIGHVGGLGALSKKLGILYGAQAGEILSFGPTHWNEAAFLFIGVLSVQWFAQVSSDGTGYLAQRSMACRTDRDARVAGTIFTFAQVLLRGLLWLPIAVGLLILYPVDHLPALGSAPEHFRIAREATFAIGIRDLLPAGVRGLMLTGMLAALASTVDTHLNWGASYWTNDLYHRFLMQKLLKREPRPRELVWVARGSGVGILLIALFIAIRLSSIQSAWHLSLLFGSGLGVMLILRWLWYRINVYSELAAVVVSLGLSPVLLFGFKDMPEGARLLWMVVISTIAVVATTLLTRPEADATLKRFFKQARPMGWWGPVARKVGVDPSQSRRAFFRAAGAVALACVTLFGLKIGTGILMLQTPHGLAIAGPCLAIALGLAVVPLWLRLGFKDFSPSRTKRVIN